MEFRHHKEIRKLLEFISVSFVAMTVFKNSEIFDFFL